VFQREVQSFYLSPLINPSDKILLLFLREFNRNFLIYSSYIGFLRYSLLPENSSYSLWISGLTLYTPLLFSRIPTSYISNRALFNDSEESPVRLRISLHVFAPSNIMALITRPFYEPQYLGVSLVVPVASCCWNNNPICSSPCRDYLFFPILWLLF
jgi:hypothetical protein